MTAAIHKYRYTYSIPLRHSIPIRGNTKARTVQEVRDILAVTHGPELAELAVINVSSVEEATNE